MRIPRSHKSWWKRPSTWLFISDVFIAVAVAGISATSGVSLLARGFAVGLRRLWRAGEQSRWSLPASAAIQFKEGAKGESTDDLAGCLQTLRGAGGGGQTRHG